MPYNDKMPTEKMPKGIKCPAVTKYLYRQNVHRDKMPSSDKWSPQFFELLKSEGLLGIIH